MSKGSRPRPFSVSPGEFNQNMDKIFGEKPKKERYVPPPLPDIKVEKKNVDWGNVKDSDQCG